MCYYHSLNNFYKDANRACDFNMYFQVEDVEHNAHIMDKVRQIAEQKDKLQKAIKRISAAITKMKTKEEELSEESQFQKLKKWRS